MSSFVEEFNRSYYDDPRLIREYVHAVRDLGCVPATGASPDDNYARLQPVIGKDTKIPVTLDLGAESFAVESTLQASPYQGLRVVGGAGPRLINAEANYPYTEPTIQSFEFGGPAGGFVWTGGAGGKLLQINGEFQIWENVGFQGKWHSTNANFVQGAIDFATCAGAAVFFNQGDTNLTGSPPINRPGKQGFYNCTFGAASAGTMFGDTFASNHADESVFVNCNWRHNEDHIYTRCQNTIGLTFVHPRMSGGKRSLRLAGGGQFTFINGFLGPGTFGSSQLLTEPTLIHVERCETNQGNITFINTNLDATLAQCKIEDAVSAATNTTVFRGSASLSASNDAYNGRRLYMLTGATAGQSSLITDYVGSTKEFTLTTALSTTPSVSDEFAIGSIRIVDHGAIAIGTGTKDSAFYTGAAISTSSQSMLKLTMSGILLQHGIPQTQLFRLKGPMLLTLNDVWGIRNNIFEMEHILSGSWDSGGSMNVGPNVVMNGCTWRQTFDPTTNLIYGSSGQDYCASWYGSRKSSGRRIADSFIDTF